MAYRYAQPSLLSPKLLLCIFLIILPCISASSSSDSSVTSYCLTADSLYDCSKCDCGINYLQLSFNLIFSCLTFIALTITVIGFIVTKEMREAPGDIVFGLCISDIVLVVEWMVQDSYALDGRPLDPSGTSCQAVAYIDVTSNLLNNLYNVVFLCFFLLATRASLKITRIPQYLYHLIPLIGTVAGVAIYSTKSLLGMSMYGTCSFRTASSYTEFILLIILFIVFPFIITYAVKKTLPECKKLSTVRYQFLRYYLAYVFTSCFFTVATSLCDIVMTASVNDMIENPYYIGTPVVAIVLGNIFSVLRPFTLGVIRLFDPNIRKHWPKVFICLRGKSKSTIKISMLGEVQKEDFDGRQRLVSLSMLEMQESLKNTPYLHQIQHTVRVQVLYSLLSSIHFYWRISKKTMLHSYSYASSGFKVDYKKMAKLTEHIKINDTVLKRELPEMMREIQINDYKGIEGSLIIHAPGIFREIMEMDGKSDGLSISLDLSANYNRIIKAGINAGGKSGEFFFFSYDNSLVIKTISDRELKTFLEILPSYSQHFKANPHSLIAKIYGVFTFKRAEPYEKYNLILMKNVNGHPSECVERKYDLKGSTYQRVTVKTGNPTMPELKYFDVLKDLDFLKFEKKLNIETHLKENFIKILKSDSEFLRKNRLIDYSMVVYVLKKRITRAPRDSNASIGISSREHEDAQTYTGPSAVLFDTSLSEESPNHHLKVQRARTVTNRKDVNNIHGDSCTYHEMRSTTEDSVSYHIGIIDYLIKYTWKKRLEKYGKKLLACNPKLDISVQSPSFYARRFRSFMEKIVT